MEDEIINPGNDKEPKPAKQHIPEVYILRDWKEYAGESLLIIFSVLLALILTEFINNLHEKSETRNLLENVRTELSINRKLEAEQYAYHQTVLKIIDSAIGHADFQRKIVSNDEFHLKYLAPHGITYHYLSDVAWEVARAHNVSSKINFSAISLLTSIYANQKRITQVDDEIGKILLSRDSRKAENTHATLVLVRDNFIAWAVDRAPGLMKQYDEAIQLLDKEKLGD